MEVRADDLIDFVSECDRLSLNSERFQSYVQNFRYEPKVKPDVSLDPFGDIYYQQQISLYEEIAKRTLDQGKNEKTFFPLEQHVNAPNPYCNISPSNASVHLTRLLKVYRAAELRYGADFLDMGAGWGLSSEIAAYIGCDVTAVDINPDFVELINRRASRMNIRIKPQVGSFDQFQTDLKYDFIFFYECLHHAVRPWHTIERLSRFLKPEGKIGFIGEPINQHWWPNWGLRLDPVSIYCIHKFGWFESGWSLDFISKCFTRSEMSIQVISDDDPEIGTAVIATQSKT